MAAAFPPNANGPLIGPGTPHFECEWEAVVHVVFRGQLERMGGKATLAIMPLNWTADGWPVVTGAHQSPTTLRQRRVMERH